MPNLASDDPPNAPSPYEIAEILGVSKQRAHQLAASQGFPTPVERDGRGRLSSRWEVKRGRSVAEGEADVVGRSGGTPRSPARSPTGGADAGLPVAGLGVPQSLYACSERCHGFSRPDGRAEGSDGVLEHRLARDVHEGKAQRQALRELVHLLGLREESTCAARMS
jgi:hypothetical protein